MGNDTKAPGAFQALRDALPTLRGWKFDRAEPTDEDGIAAVGTTWEDSEDFAPILSVDAGLYHQGELALPLAQAISAILCAAPALLAEVDRCHRSLKAAGFTDHGGEAWEPPIPKEATTLVNMLRESQAEVDRLTAALKKANDQAEHFERQWYLRGDEVEALHHNADILQTALTPAQVDARPIAWLCELYEEDGSVKTQIVEQDPAGLNFNDAGDPSPFRVTPLFKRSTNV